MLQPAYTIKQHMNTFDFDCNWLVVTACNTQPLVRTVLADVFAGIVATSDGYGCGESTTTCGDGYCESHLQTQSDANGDLDTQKNGNGTSHQL